jgi:hypothetical protein
MTTLLPEPVTVPKRVLTPIPVQDATWKVLWNGDTFDFRSGTTDEKEIQEGAVFYKLRQKIPPLRVIIPTTDSAAYAELRNSALDTVFRTVVRDGHVTGPLNDVDKIVIDMLQDYKSYDTDVHTYRALVVPEADRLGKSIFAIRGGRNNLQDIVVWYHNILKLDVATSKAGSKQVIDEFHTVIFVLALEAYGMLYFFVLFCLFSLSLFFKPAMCASLSLSV